MSYNTGYAYPEKIGFFDGNGNPLDKEGNPTTTANQYVLEYENYEFLTTEEQMIFDTMKIYVGEHENEELNVFCPIPVMIVTPLELEYTWEGLPKEAGIDGFTVTWENTSSPNDKWTYELLSEIPSWINSINIVDNKVQIDVKSAQADEPAANWTGIVIKSTNPERLIQTNLVIRRDAAPSTVGFQWIPYTEGGASCEK